MTAHGTLHLDVKFKWWVKPFFRGIIVGAWLVGAAGVQPWACAFVARHGARVTAS